MKLFKPRRSLASTVKGKKKKKVKTASDIQRYIAQLLEDIRDGKRTANRPKDFF